MADKFEAKLKIDKELTKWLASAETTFNQTVRETMDKVGAHAAERSKVLAPIKHGPLRASITHKLSSFGSSKDVWMDIIATEHYALRMHEELTPFGPLQLGPRSRAQPTAPEGGVGGKYIARAIEYHVKNYEKFFGDNLQKFLGKAGQVKVKIRNPRFGTT